MAKEVIDLAVVSNPSVMILRDVWRIPLPEDPRVFLLELTDRNRKEEYLRSLDSLFSPIRESSREMGKTFYGRFVLVDPSLRRDRFYSKGRFERVLGHELVHAYVKSAIGLERDRLPKWFHEGLASHLSDARAGAVTHEYRVYAGVFEFLQERFGESVVAELVRSGVQLGHIDLSLLETLQFESEAKFIRASVNWQDTKRVQIVAPIFLAIALFLLRTTVLFRFPRRVVLTGWRLFHSAGVRSRSARRLFYRLDQAGAVVGRDKLNTLIQALESEQLRAGDSLYQLNRIIRIAHQMKEDDAVVQIFDERDREGQLTLRNRRHQQTLQKRLATMKEKYPHLWAIQKTDSSLHVLEPAHAALRWIKDQPRPLRKWFWRAEPEQLASLSTILDIWAGSVAQDALWQRRTTKTLGGSLALCILVCWVVPSISVRGLFALVQWINR